MANGTTNQQIGANNFGGVINGARALTNIQSTRKTPQFLGPVRINKNIAPVYTLAKKSGIKKDTQQAAFFWDEEDGLPVTVNTSSSTVNSGDTTITLQTGQGTRLFANQNLWCERTGEFIHVVSISTDTVTVVRAVTTTPVAAAINTGALTGGEELRVMAPNFPEGSLAPAGLSVEPPLITNYTQTMRRAYEGSRRLINSQNFGTDEWKRMEEDTMDAMMRDTEFAFLFNSGLLATDNTAASGGGTISQGISAFITDNNFNVGGNSAQESDIANWLLVWMRMNTQDASNLVLVGGDAMSRLIDSIGRDNIRYSTDDKYLGMKVQSFQSSVGSMDFIRHPAFTPQYGSITGANSGLVGKCLGLNYKNIGICTYKGGKLKRETEIQAIGTDGKKIGFLQDMGFICQNQRTHIAVYGMAN